MLQGLANLSGGASGLRDRSRPEVASLHGGDRHVDRFLAEAAELGIELEIIAGDLLARGNIDDGVALVENAEICVRTHVVIHELDVVEVDDANAVDLQMRVAVA